jgi:S-methylmethionine-dependent homocysteine/selenocysteine methylase
MSANYDSISARLSRGDVVILDGGTGSTIEAHGVEMDPAAWGALANIDHPDVVREVHEAFIVAGADVVLANTFSAARPALAAAGRADDVVEINRLGVRAAQAARDAFPDRTVIVGGSISSYPASSFLADRLPRFTPPTTQALCDAYAEQVDAQVSEGADMLVLEMMNSPSYGEIALNVARGAEVPVWLGVSPVQRDEGTIGAVSDGPEDGLTLDDLLAALVGSELSVVGLMHCEASVVEPALDVLRAHWDGSVMVYPEVGTWRPPSWQPGELTPEEFLGLCQRWVDRGVQLVGGCCGIGPDHIAALRDIRPAPSAPTDQDGEAS